MINRCFQCMEPLENDEICPKCGFDSNSSTKNIEDFKGGCFLKERYFLGNVFSKTLDSTVYLAYDEALNKKVFVREFTGEGIAKISSKYTAPELRQKFLTYAKGTATQNLCNILPHTVDAFSQEDACYLVTDYFDGESLKTLLNSGINISSSNALKIADQLLKGLEPIHNAGAIFGAISPETLYLLKNGEIRLFGLPSRFYDFLEDFDARVEILNPSYSAPEIFDDISLSGVHSDVYSVGAILYRILTKTIPPIGFLRSGGENLIAPAKINKNIPKNLSTTLLNALNWQIDRRTTNTSVFLKELSSKKVKRLRSGAIIWANILGLFQKSEHSSTNKKEKKRSLLWLWITVPAIILIIFILLLIFLFPGGSNDSSSPSNLTEVSSDDGWYYGNGKETPTSSNDYVYGGYTSKDNQNSNHHRPSSNRNESAFLNNSSLISNSSFTPNPNQVLYPGYVGNFFDDIKSDLQKSGLKIGKVTYEKSDIHYTGYIIKESVKPDTYLEKGSTIDFVVCNNAELPNVSGLSLRDAESAIKSAGYNNIKFEFIESNLPEGTAVKANFGKNTNPTTSSIVYIIVSGESTNPVKNYVGKTADQAIDASVDLKFLFVDENGATISSLDDPSLYKVTAQDIPAGSDAYVGMEVTLTVKHTLNSEDGN